MTSFLSTRARTTVVLVALVSLLLPATALAQSAATVPPWRIEIDSAREQVNVIVGDDTLLTDLALTSSQQQLGLGYRNTLAPESAMLFVSEDSSARSFWMKGMRICLDIIWIENGEIIGAAENTCPDPVGTADADRLRVTSPGPVTYVLEVNAGWLEEHGYDVGTTVTIPELPTS